MARGSQREGGSARGASAEHGADEVGRDQAQVEAEGNEEEVVSSGETTLEALGVDELRKIAGDLEVVGRSEMKKGDLIDAIRRAESTLRAAGTYNADEPAKLGHVAAVEDRMRQLEERVARLDNTVAAMRAGTTSPQEAP
jgi:hypothetical protein